MSILTFEEIVVLEGNLELLDMALEKITERKKLIKNRLEQISKISHFLIKRLGNFGRTIFKFFFHKKQRELDDLLQKEMHTAQIISEKIDTYARALHYFKEKDDTTAKNIREILQCLCCMMIDYRISTQIPISLWNIKCDIMEKNGIKVDDINRKIIPELLSILN
ncbi:MAG: hypothetical protein US70_C0015G0012 [Parcubacteria group bacterium GW2011_GWD2_38_11]|nr:MAG: hypothetical protein US70_C0015G0012 [Parcubacteria group bacterium GW2011_GWD2_38_11]